MPVRSSRALLLAGALLTTPAFAQGLVIGGFDGGRGGPWSIAHGAEMQMLRDEIVAAFPGSTFVGAQTLTPGFLGGLDAVMLSSVRTGTGAITPLTSAEQAALLDFALGGGRCLLFVDNNGFDQDADTANESVVDAFGLDVGGIQFNNQPATVVAASPITDGPFGTVTTFETYFPGSFNGTGIAQVLARLDADGAPALVWIAPQALAPLSGPVVAWSDSSLFSNANFEPAAVPAVLNGLGVEIDPPGGFFDGLLVSPRGDAALTFGSTLSVTGIGSSGLDGFTLDLVGATGLMLHSGVSSLPSAGASSTLSLECDGLPIASLTMTLQQDFTCLIETGFPGADGSAQVLAYLDGALVAAQSVPLVGGAPEITIASGARPDATGGSTVAFVPDSPDAHVGVEVPPGLAAWWDAPTTIELDSPKHGAGVIVADLVVVTRDTALCADPQSTGATVLARDLDTLEVTAIGPSVAGRTLRAINGAVFGPRNGGILAHLGAGGDGVRVYPGAFTGSLLTLEDIEPIADSDESVVYTVECPEGGLGFEPTATLRAEADQGEVVYTPDYPNPVDPGIDVTIYDDAGAVLAEYQQLEAPRVVAGQRWASEMGHDARPGAQPGTTEITLLAVLTEADAVTLESASLPMPVGLTGARVLKFVDCVLDGEGPGFASSHRATLAAAGLDELALTGVRGLGSYGLGGLGARVVTGSQGWDDLAVSTAFSACGEPGQTDDCGARPDAVRLAPDAWLAPAELALGEFEAFDVIVEPTAPTETGTYTQTLLDAGVECMRTTATYDGAGGAVYDFDAPGATSYHVAVYGDGAILAAFDTASRPSVIIPLLPAGGSLLGGTDGGCVESPCVNDPSMSVRVFEPTIVVVHDGGGQSTLHADAEIVVVTPDVVIEPVALVVRVETDLASGVELRRPRVAAFETELEALGQATLTTDDAGDFVVESIGASGVDGVILDTQRRTLPAADGVRLAINPALGALTALARDDAGGISARFAFDAAAGEVRLTPETTGAQAYDIEFYDEGVLVGLAPGVGAPSLTWDADQGVTPFVLGFDHPHAGVRVELDAPTLLLASDDGAPVGGAISADAVEVRAIGATGPSSLEEVVLRATGDAGATDSVSLLGVWYVEPCYADLSPEPDGDGMVNTNDFFQFLSYYQAQDARADFPPPQADGQINTNDLFAFLAAYQLGCF